MNEDPLTVTTSEAPIFTFKPRYLVRCPKHGDHEHMITSAITGHEGIWCLICAIERLGPSLERVESKP